MNAPRTEQSRTRRTQTFWPVTRRPEPQTPPGAHDTHRDVEKDDEPGHEEPGYGHGV